MFDGRSFSETVIELGDGTDADPLLRNPGDVQVVENV
jgi:hypothetical protein